MLHRSATIAPLLNPQGAKPLEGLEIHGPCSFCFDASCKSQVLHLNVKKDATSNTARLNLLTTAPSHCKLVMPPSASSSSSSSSSKLNQQRKSPTSSSSILSDQKRSAGGGAGAASSANCFSTQLISLPIFTFQLMLETLQSEIDIEFILLDTSGRRQFLVVSTAVNQSAPKRMSNSGNEELHYLPVRYPHGVWSEFVVDVTEAFRLGYEITQKQRIQHQETLAASTTYITNNNNNNLRDLSLNKAKMSARNQNDKNGSICCPIAIQAVERVNFHSKGGPCKLRRVTAVASSFMSNNNLHHSPDVDTLRGANNNNSLLILPSALQFPSGVQYEQVNWKNSLVALQQEENNKKFQIARKKSPENKNGNANAPRAASAGINNNDQRRKQPPSSGTARQFNFISVASNNNHIQQEKSNGSEISGLNSSNHHNFTMTSGGPKYNNNHAIKKPEILMMMNVNNNNNNNNAKKAPSISSATTCRSTTMDNFHFSNNNNTNGNSDEDILSSAAPISSHRNNHNNNLNNNALHAHFSELPPQHSKKVRPVSSSSSSPPIRRTHNNNNFSCSSNSGLIHTPISSISAGAVASYRHQKQNNNMNQQYYSDPHENNGEASNRYFDQNEQQEYDAHDEIHETNNHHNQQHQVFGTRKRTSSKTRTLLNDKNHATIETTTTTTTTKTTTTTILPTEEQEKMSMMVVEEEIHDDASAGSHSQHPVAVNHEEIHQRAVQRIASSSSASASPSLFVSAPRMNQLNNNNEALLIAADSNQKRHMATSSATAAAKALLLINTRPASATSTIIMTNNANSKKICQDLKSECEDLNLLMPVASAPQSSAENAFANNKNNEINNTTNFQDNLRPQTSGSIGPIRTSANSPKILHRTNQVEHNNNNINVKSEEKEEEDQEQQPLSIIRQRLSTLDPVEIEKKIEERRLFKVADEELQERRKESEVTKVESHKKQSANASLSHVSPIKKRDKIEQATNKNDPHKVGDGDCAEDTALDFSNVSDEPRDQEARRDCESDEIDDDRETMTEMLNDVSRVLSSRPATSFPRDVTKAKNQKLSNNNNNNYFQNLLQISAMTTSTTTLTATVMSNQQHNGTKPMQNLAATKKQNQQKHDDEGDDDEDDIDTSSVVRRLSLENNIHAKKQQSNNNNRNIQSRQSVQEEQKNNETNFHLKSVPPLIFDHNSRSLSLATPFVRRECKFPLLHNVNDDGEGREKHSVLREQIILNWLNTKFQVKVGGPDRFISCFEEENCPQVFRYDDAARKNKKLSIEAQEQEKSAALPGTKINNNKKSEEEEEVETLAGGGDTEEQDSFDLRKSVQELKIFGNLSESKQIQQGNSSSPQPMLDFSKMIWDPVICMFFDPQNNTFHFRK